MDYKLEYMKGATGGPTDDGVFIQLKQDLPAYQKLISKEDYSALPSTSQSTFMTGLFAVSGVVRAASQAYRIYVEKGPAFDWEDVKKDVLKYLLDQIGGLLSELPGSGVKLETPNDRRPF